MIEHVVLLQPRPDAGETDVERLQSALLGLQDRIPGILDVAWGENVSPEGLDRGFTLGFIVRFADAAARDAYLPHPDHRAVVPLVGELAEQVLVFDFQTTGL